MHSLFAPGSVVTLFVAGVLFFVVAERLSLASRKAGLAVKLSAGALTLSVVLDMPFIMYRLMPETDAGPALVSALHDLLVAASWGGLAWAVLALLADAPKEEVR